MLKRGIEPQTFALLARRSNQLSYSSTERSPTLHPITLLSHSQTQTMPEPSRHSHSHHRHHHHRRDREHHHRHHGEEKEKNQDQDEGIHREEMHESKSEAKETVSHEQPSQNTEQSDPLLERVK